MSLHQKIQSYYLYDHCPLLLLSYVVSVGCWQSLLLLSPAPVQTNTIHLNDNTDGKNCGIQVVLPRLERGNMEYTWRKEVWYQIYSIRVSSPLLSWSIVGHQIHCEGTSGVRMRNDTIYHCCNSPIVLRHPSPLYALTYSNCLLMYPYSISFHHQGLGMLSMEEVGGKILQERSTVEKNWV